MEEQNMNNPDELKKWRPFEGTNDLACAICMHGSWVINTNNQQHCQIVAFDNSRVLVAQTTKTYKELLENFIFDDYTHCGVPEIPDAN